MGEVVTFPLKPKRKRPNIPFWEVVMVGRGIVQAKTMEKALDRFQQTPEEWEYQFDARIVPDEGGEA